MKKMLWRRPEQDKLVALLVESPLPWTPKMIGLQLGWARAKVISKLMHSTNNGRIWRIERGMYTNALHRHPPIENIKPFNERVPPRLSDDVVARYTGLNL